MSVESVDLYPDLRRGIGDQIFDQDRPEPTPGLGRRGGLLRLERRVRKARNPGEMCEVRGGELALLLFFPQAKDQSSSAHARRVEPLAGEIEKRDRDRRVLHAEEPLHVFVASPHCQPTHAEDAGNPRGGRVVTQEQLVRAGVDPAAQLSAGDDDVDRREGAEHATDENESNHDSQAFSPRGRPTGRAATLPALTSRFRRRSGTLSFGNGVNLLSQEDPDVQDRQRQGFSSP